MAERNKDLEIIKRKYGEKMAHLCRELFPTLLESEGLLPKILLSKFREDKSLYDVIVNNNKQDEFKDYLYSFIDVENNNAVIVNKTPKELLGEAGYDFYICETEKDILSLKKYYASGETLCTFNGNRLATNHVFWAVKKNVDEIKREKFDKPTRQDKYGTSVISIQFARGEKNTLSIKNRYNHKVNNPDATFGNNLENIIEGLTASFEREYGLSIISNMSEFELPNFVLSGDGKWYRYNHEVNNIYYCPNNVIINNGRVVSLDSSKLLIDYFIINLSGENKGFDMYDKEIKDSFIDGLQHARKITVTGQGDEKKVILTLETGDVTIGLNKDNQITSLDYPQLTRTGDGFLRYNRTLQTVSLPQLTQAGNYFLFRNKAIQALSLPQLDKLGGGFLPDNIALHTLSLPQLSQAGDSFLHDNQCLQTLSLPQLTQAGDRFLYRNECLQTLSFPKLIHVGACFLFRNKSIETLSLPKLTYAGSDFLYCNNTLATLSLPQLAKAGSRFLKLNETFNNLSPEQIRAQSIAAETAIIGSPPITHRALGSFSGLKKPEQQKEK